MARAATPTYRIRRRKGEPSDADIEQLLQIAPAPERLAICLMADAGCRLREALSFAPSSLTGQHGNQLLRIWSTKNSSWRTVPVTARLQRALLSHRRQLNISPRALQRRLLELCASAGTQETTPHRLRHSYATRLARSGIPLHTISQLLGHKSLTVTLIYIHGKESDYAKARKALNRLASAASRSRVTGRAKGPTRPG